MIYEYNDFGFSLIIFYLVNKELSICTLNIEAMT